MISQEGNSYQQCLLKRSEKFNLQLVKSNTGTDDVSR